MRMYGRVRGRPSTSVCTVCTELLHCLSYTMTYKTRLGDTVQDDMSVLPLGFVVCKVGSGGERRLDPDPISAGQVLW